MFGLGASPHFPDAGSWWCDPPSLAAVADSPWDVAEISAWQKHLEEEAELSPLQGESRELLTVEDPVSLEGAVQGGVNVDVEKAPGAAFPNLNAFQELEAIKAKVRKMEKEDEWLQELQAEAKDLIMRSDPGLTLPRTIEEKVEADHRSIYVGNVDYGGTAEELESHFNSCGQINRVTILCDKFSGHPKGYAYIEFEDKSSVKAATELDESTFRGRIIKVLPKRTNMPGISTTDRGGGRGRFHGRGALPRHTNFCGGQRSRPRGRVYRGRGRLSPWYAPY